MPGISHFLPGITTRCVQCNFPSNRTLHPGIHPNRIKRHGHSGKCGTARRAALSSRPHRASRLHPRASQFALLLVPRTCALVLLSPLPCRFRYSQVATSRCLCAPAGACAPVRDSNNLSLCPVFRMVAFFSPGPGPRSALQARPSSYISPSCTPATHPRPCRKKLQVEASDAGGAPTFALNGLSWVSMLVSIS